FSGCGPRLRGAREFGQNLVGAAVFLYIAGGTAHKNLMPAGRLGHSGRVIGAGDDNVIDVRIAALELNKLKLRERGLVYAFRHGVFAHERDGNQMLAGFRMETDFQALLRTAVLVGFAGGVSDFRSL